MSHRTACGSVRPPGTCSSPGPKRPGPGGPVKARREPIASRLRGKGVARSRAAGDSEPANKVSDEELMRALYAEHAAALLRFTLRMTDGDRQRAEDIVQETLLRAWLHPE